MAKKKQPVRTYPKGKRTKVTVPVRRYPDRVERLCRIIAQIMMEPEPTK